MSDSNAADLLARLASADRAEQRRACDEAAQRIRAEPGVRDALRELLRDPRPLARFAAAFVLFHAERPTLRLLPALLDSLELADVPCPEPGPGQVLVHLHATGVNFSDTERRREVYKNLDAGVNLIGPECAVPLQTTIENLKEIPRAIKAWHREHTTHN